MKLRRTEMAPFLGHPVPASFHRWKWVHTSVFEFLSQLISHILTVPNNVPYFFVFDHLWSVVCFIILMIKRLAILLTPC